MLLDVKPKKSKIKEGDRFVFYMRIMESKNLKYDTTSKITSGGSDYDRLEFRPGVCVLEGFERLDDTLILHFKNKTYAVIKAHNIEGSREIDLIERKLPSLLKHSYEEILGTDLTATFI